MTKTRRRLPPNSSAHSRLLLLLPRSLPFQKEEGEPRGCSQEKKTSMGKNPSGKWPITSCHENQAQFFRKNSRKHSESRNPVGSSAKRPNLDCHIKSGRPIRWVFLSFSAEGAEEKKRSGPGEIFPQWGGRSGVDFWGAEGRLRSGCPS